MLRGRGFYSKLDKRSDHRSASLHYKQFSWPRAYSSRPGKLTLHPVEVQQGKLQCYRPPIPLLGPAGHSLYHCFLAQGWCIPVSSRWHLLHMSQNIHWIHSTLCNHHQLENNNGSGQYYQSIKAYLQIKSVGQITYGWLMQTSQFTVGPISFSSFSFSYLFLFHV